MKTLTVRFRDGGPRITEGLRLSGRVHSERKFLALGERGAGRRWEEIVTLDRQDPPPVVERRVFDAGVCTYTPQRRDESLPPSTYFALTADDERQPGLLIRIDTRSPGGAPGDWSDPGPPGSMPSGYGAYDKAGIETCKDGLVVMHDGDELVVTVGSQAYVLCVDHGELSIHPRSGA